MTMPSRAPASEKGPCHCRLLALASNPNVRHLILLPTSPSHHNNSWTGGGRRRRGGTKEVGGVSISSSAGCVPGQTEEMRRCCRAGAGICSCAVLTQPRACGGHQILVFSTLQIRYQRHTLQITIDCSNFDSLHHYQFFRLQCSSFAPCTATTK